MDAQLDDSQRGTCQKALARIKRVTEEAKKHCDKASIGYTEAETQIGYINGADTQFNQSPLGEPVKLIAHHRAVIVLGLGLLKGDIDQTKSREESLGIDIDGSLNRLDELDRLIGMLGEQSEIPLPPAPATKADRELVKRAHGKKGKRSRETAGAR
jgi:hypothetical protein